MIADIWDSLRSDSSRTSGVLSRRLIPDAPLVLRAAVRKPKNTPMLLVEMETRALPPAFADPGSKGFTAAVVPIAAGPEGRVRVELELTQPAGEQVFMALVDDVVRRIAAESTPCSAGRALLEALHKWQAFFQRHGCEGLTPEQQQGLFGELLFLRDYLAVPAGLDVAVMAWTGPKGSNQDFEYGGRSFEVKTTSANPLSALRISNLRQLDDKCVDALRLVVLEVERHRNSEGTLPQIVDSLRQSVLERSPQAALELADRLMEYGYLDQHSGMYATVGYGVRRVRYFEVVEGFPRIIERDVMSGVGDVKYSVATSALTPFELNDTSFMQELREWFGDLG